ncbi:uncharacterized protein LOC127770942 [Oryza glaberrima]|nr:uncharacterized protein LOC127770942 [Oryza glaberrima]
MSAVERKTACVTGGSGYIASALIKMLLQKGYAVKTTVRNPDDMEKNSHFKELQALGPLKIFRADLEEEGSFDEAVAGCDYAFLVAAPMNLKSQNPEKELLEAGVQGTLNVLRSCVKAGTVKRVILTSSAAAVSGQPLQGDGNGSSHVLDESSWSDLDYLRSTNGISPAQAYAIAKVLSEKEASKLAEENGISLVAVCPVATVGASPAPVANESVANVLSLLSVSDSISGNEEINTLRMIDQYSGGLKLVHVDDLCRAEIFLAEKASPSPSGRYICCALNTTIRQIARSLAAKYPHYNVDIDALGGGLPEKPTILLSSEKLTSEGFEFMYKTVDEMYDDAFVEYGMALGILHYRERETTMSSEVERKTVCVTGGNGYVASLLVKMLLEKGYAVQTTVRDPNNPEKVSHFKDMEKLGPLKVFRANLEDEGSFDEAVAGCHYAFLVAAPVYDKSHKSDDLEKEIVQGGVEGTLNVMRSCARAGTVKRVILTSSTAAVSSLRPLEGAGHVLDESSWSDIEYLRSMEKLSPTQAYSISKVLSEKEATKFAEENGLSLVTLCPVVAVGASPVVRVDTSVPACLSLITGDEEMMNILKGIEKASGWSMPMVHIEDVCRAEIFVAEEESASGRYICGSLNTTVTEIAGFLAAKYPQYNVRCDCIEEHHPEKPTISLSSAKLIGEGFEFKYKNLDEMYDDLVAYGKALGLIPN